VKIKSIYNYPVKSLGGNNLESVVVEKRGLKNDRRFMFIDSNNNFVTARTHHKLGGISVQQNSNDLIFYNNFNNSSVYQPIEISSNKIKVSIWGTATLCHLIINNTVDKWISTFVGEPIRLVYMADDDIRVVNPKYGKTGEIVSFADGFPILITNTQSLDDLNNRLQIPVPMTRFRPNLVIEGNLPWEEDHWKKIKIGEVVIRIVKPCARCVVTTINPETGEMNKEPIHTLSLFRKENNNVLFGMNAIAEQFGLINEGDDIEIL
jgi:uncharacterized protein YcbX